MSLAKPRSADPVAVASCSSSSARQPPHSGRCPDGYAGEYPTKLPRGKSKLDGTPDGYPDFSNASCNPFSNKVRCHT